MNEPLSREQWINIRTAELLRSDDAVPELFDQITIHDGLASHGLRAHLRAWLYGETPSIREQAANQATNIVGSFAFMRARSEYDSMRLMP